MSENTWARTATGDVFHIVGDLDRARCNRRFLLAGRSRSRDEARARTDMRTSMCIRCMKLDSLPVEDKDAGDRPVDRYWYKEKPRRWTLHRKGTLFSVTGFECDPDGTEYVSFTAHVPRAPGKPAHVRNGSMRLEQFNRIMEPVAGGPNESATPDYVRAQIEADLLRKLLSMDIIARVSDPCDEAEEHVNNVLGSIRQELQKVIDERTS